jgi:putative DNA primase/helicase
MIEFDQLNYDSSFTNAMEAAGIRPLEPIARRLASGELVRFRAEGDKPGRKNGWARLFNDSRAGVFGHFRLGISTSWHAEGCARALSEVEKRKIALEFRRHETERHEANEKAAQMARDLWSRATMADPAHPYLQGKALAPFGVRQKGHELLVPMWDTSFRIQNIQRIGLDLQHKRFLKGGRTARLFWAWGTHREDGYASFGPLVIAEGYATAAAIYEATGFAVVAAMSSSNLGSVAVTMRQMFPSREIIVGADYDGHLTQNRGLEEAQQAAQRINAKVAIPVPECPLVGLKIDFADLPRSETAAIIKLTRKKDIRHG